MGTSESELRDAVEQLAEQIRGVQALRCQKFPLEPGGLRAACMPMAHAGLRVWVLMKEAAVPMAPLPRGVVAADPNSGELQGFCNLQVCETVLAEARCWLEDPRVHGAATARRVAA